MSTHRRNTHMDRFNAGAKKVGHGIAVGAGVVLEVAHRAALRADADLKEEEAREARLALYKGEHPKGFLGGWADSVIKDDEAKKAQRRYDEAIAR